MRQYQKDVVVYPCVIKNLKQENDFQQYFQTLFNGLNTIDEFPKNGKTKLYFSSYTINVKPTNELLEPPSINHMLNTANIDEQKSKTNKPKIN